MTKQVNALNTKLGIYELQVAELKNRKEACESINAKLEEDYSILIQ